MKIKLFLAGLIVSTQLLAVGGEKQKICGKIDTILDSGLKRGLVVTLVGDDFEYYFGTEKDSAAFVSTKAGNLTLCIENDYVDASNVYPNQIWVRSFSVK